MRLITSSYKTICINKYNDYCHVENFEMAKKNGYKDKLCLAAWNVLRLFFTYRLCQMKLELEKYNIVTAAVQETE
jgi:hypothetical protein